MTKKENQKTGLTVPDILEHIQNELTKVFKQKRTPEMTAKDAAKMTIEYCLGVLTNGGATQQEVDEYLKYDLRVEHDTLIMTPKNLYTTLIMSGRYVHPAKLIGAFEYEFDDCTYGYTEEHGAYLKPRVSVQSITVNMTISKEGIKI